MKPFQMVAYIVFVIAFSLAYLASDNVNLISLPLMTRIVLSDLSIIAFLLAEGPYIISWAKRILANLSKRRG